MDCREIHDPGVRIGDLVWRLEPDGGYLLGEVVSRDEARSAFSVAWLTGSGGAFHVPERLLGLGDWGLGEPPADESTLAEALPLRVRFASASGSSPSLDDAEAA